MFDRAPAVKLCLPFIAGIIIGWYWALPLALLLSFLFALACISPILYRKQSLSYALSVSMIGLMIILGMLKISLDGKIQSDNCLLYYVNDEEKDVTLVGTISERATARQRSYSMTVDAESLSVSGRMVNVSGGVIVSMWKDNVSPQTIQQLAYGKRVSLEGSIRLPGHVRNPGEFDYRNYLKMQGVYAQVLVRSDDDIQTGERTGSWILSSVIHPFRDWISLTMDSLVGGDESKLLKGLVIGERSEIDNDVKMAFTNAGLMHILAVSGLNVALVTIMFWSVFSIFRLPRLVIGLLTMIGLVFFCVLTGGEASVMRAVIMAGVFIGAKVFERTTNLYNVVAIAAFLILLGDARWLFDVGFQLSFIAVLSLAYIYPKLQALVEKLPPRLQVNSYIKKYFFLSMAVSLAATLGSLPFTAYYFHKISIVGIFMNLLAVPLSGLILALGCVVVVTAATSTWLGSVYATAAYASAWGLLQFTKWGGNLPFSVIPVNVHFGGALAMAILLLVLIESHRARVRRYAIIGVLLVSNVYLYSSLLNRENHTLKVTMIDVGEGDATLIETPNGKTILVDTGPENYRSDNPETHVTSFLRQKGIDRIDALIITHPHADHLGGAPVILKDFEVGDVYEGNANSHSLLVTQWSHDLDSLHIPCHRIYAGEEIMIDSSIRLYVLHPFVAQDSLQGNLNNHSIVAKLVYGNTSLLLTGDAEIPVESRLITSYDKFLVSDVIKVGHHGSNTSSSANFLSAVNPKLALISVGYKNKFRDPSPKVLARYRVQGSDILRTDKHGAIILESDGNGWRQKEWRED